VALKLIPPGKRGPHYIIRGRRGGHLIERSTGTSNIKEARQRLRELEEAVGDTPKLGQITFAEAARRYVEFRNPSVVDRQRLEKVVNALGNRRLRDITASDIHIVANQLGGAGSAASTRNRNFLRPAVTVLHYAAGAGLCGWLRVKTFREPRLHTRALDRDAALALIAAAEPGPKRLLVTWLFYQGTRISDTLRVKWDDIDIEAGTVRIHVSKTDTVRTFPIHEAVLRCLQGVPVCETGRLFPWRTRSGVRWLRDLGEQVGVKFSAHMARHSLGTWLAEDGAALRVIMDTLGHADVHSSMRYQGPDIEARRAAINRVDLRRKA
jgi:integrase